jgi:ribosome-binding factor A
MDRVSQLLQEIIAEELERLVGDYESLELVTVTSVVVQGDLRSARVYVASANEDSLASLEEARPRIQRAIARQARLKRIPHLYFEADELLDQAWQLEEILRRQHSRG